MNWLDIVVIVVMAGCTFSGLKNGIIKSVLSLAGLIFGIFLAGRYYITLADRLDMIPSDTIARIVAFILILAAVAVVTGIIAWVLRKLITAVLLGWVDRLGGAVFGLLLAALFCSLLLAIWVKFFGMADVILESGIAGVLLGNLPAVLSLLPDDFGFIRSFFYQESMLQY